MPSLTFEQFQNAVKTCYESPTTTTATADMATQLDELLRGHCAKLWEKVLLLESLTLHLTPGDPATIQLMFRGELDEVVETWQQSILSRPRMTIPDSDPEFRSKVIERFNSSCEVVSTSEIGKSLDEDFSLDYTTFWALTHQLYLCAEELAENTRSRFGRSDKNQSVGTGQDMEIEPPEPSACACCRGRNLK